MRRLVVAIIAVAAATVIGVVVHGAVQSPAGGTLVLLASAERQVQLPAQALEVHRLGGDWTELAKTRGGVVPASPGTATLATALLPPATYDDLRVGSTGIRGRFTIVAGRLLPVLVPIAGSASEAQAAYVGNDDVNLGLQELAGRLPRFPPFLLMDQHGRPFGQAQLGGHLTLIASFHTTCTETCPLYTGLLLQLRTRLPAGVLLAEATTDPWDDTPDALQAYASRAGASWTFLTGTPDALTLFWSTLGVQLGRGDSHVSTLALVDSRGYVLHTFVGVPDLGGQLPASLRALLDGEGTAELDSHGDGWGAAQVLDALAMLRTPAEQSIPGGTVAPSWSAPQLGGGPDVNSAGYAGRPLVINFWASWCDPCRAEMPMLQARAGSRPGVGLVFIDERDATAAARDFVRSIGIRSTVAVDATGDLGGRFAVVGLPVSVFVYPDGIIEGRYVGQLTQSALDQHLAAISR